MESGFSKRIMGVVVLLLCSLNLVWAEYSVTATPLTHDIKDLSQRGSKVYDQNGERCALIRFETPIPNLFSFNLGAQQIEKRENKDDEVWIWVSPDVKKMTIRCDNCTQLKDYRVALKSGNVYRAKLTTGLPQETALTQKVNIYCDKIPFTISIDGAAPVESRSRTYFTELPIGAHELVVAAKLYKTESKTIHVFRSKPYSDTIRMEDNYGEVAVTVNPSGGYTVRVDGEEHKQNRLLKLEPGNHRVVIEKDRYETYETTIEVVHKGQHSISAVMTPAFATFTITTAEDETEIWVDGKMRGRNRVNVELTWGNHRIEGRRTGYDTWEYATSDFSTTSQRTIKIPKLNKQFGSVRISFYPPQASVYVDGKLVDTESGVYYVPRAEVGHHFVQARLMDYTSVRDSFTVESGQLYTRDFTLERIPLGIATISTDPEIGIYRITQDNETVFLGHSTFTGKIPAGENIIELKNSAGVTCQYHLFINDKEEHVPVVYPFIRKLMIRTNVGKNITLKPGRRPAYEVKANKRMKLEPMKYEITATKKGYQMYKDTIDLSDPGVSSLIYRADLRRLNDTLDHPQVRKNQHLQRFYDRAGTWFIGVLDFGYTFDLNGGQTNADGKPAFKHIITAGILPFRYKMFGMSLADFEVAVADSLWKQTFCYKPRISLFLPCSDGFAFHFYAGMSLNLSDLTNAQVTQKRMSIIGGASMRFNYVGRFPMDLFAEYQYPISGVEQTTLDALNKAQLFRVGISFTGGVDH
jgi:hypothetical protein